MMNEATTTATTQYGEAATRTKVPNRPADDVASSDVFDHSAELGRAVSLLEQEQIEIDRQEAIRLASLRAMQDRD
jgi:hypothetical protein